MTHNQKYAHTVVEAAGLMGKSVRQLRQDIAERKIPHVRDGRRVLITPDAIKQYLDQRTVPALDANAEARRIVREVRNAKH